MTKMVQQGTEVHEQSVFNQQPTFLGVLKVCNVFLLFFLDKGI